MWRLIWSGALPPVRIHAIYEAIAESVSRGESPNTIHICWPDRPYVCVGVHQIVGFEVDVRECEKRRIKIVRRQVGGGAVYLDQNQFFYHIVARRGDFPGSMRDVFERMLAPTVCACRRMGMNASYRPMNDVVVDGRKISGNGAASFGSAIVVIGNIILDFDPEVFVSVLRVPDEKMKDKLASSIAEWVTSVRRETGNMPRMEDVGGIYLECFSEMFGAELFEGRLAEGEAQRLMELERKYSDPEWTYRYSKRRRILRRISYGDRVVKIMSDHYIVHLVGKPEKIIRILAEVRGDRIEDIIISGDFFVEPCSMVDALEDAIRGMSIDEVLSIDASTLADTLDIRSRESEKFVGDVLKVLSEIKKLLH